MIETVIFSRDRAMQLDLLLQSINRHDIDKRLNVNVLFSASEDAYRAGYALLREKYRNTSWIEEKEYSKPHLQSNFDVLYWHNLYWLLKYKRLRRNKTDFRAALIKLLAESEAKHIIFLTDDSVFYRDIILPDRLQNIESFSLRHGANLSGGVYETTGDWISWDVYENDFATDWGYPFSVDGHIYPKDKLLHIINKILFNNPNTLEGNVACYVGEKRLFQRVFANEQSCLAGFELNRVQTVARNNNLEISQKLLNDYYLDGYTLNINYDKENVRTFRPEILKITVNKGKEQKEIYNNG
ncbi:MAG: hypothetical protein LBR67_09485 [Dysgonamonadaceae bacterium]|jgi:hypothetical protein|nr:hypothetical protein [Dysgonamonadaceae bacterium]